ncbi:MAG TPA: serine hydrolase domain-containing protein, partial [Sphingobacteriaceae bacterium]
MKNLLFPVFLLIGHSILLTACQRDSAKLPEDVEERINLVENSIQAEGRKWTIDQRMEALKIPGVSVGVIHNYKLDWAKGYGLADIKQKREVTPSTLFQAASISKSLTGVGLVKLAQDNKVRLDEDVNQYLKSWKFPYNEITGNDKITLNNLLSHSAGLTVHGFRGYKKGRPVPTVLQVLNGEVPANNEPVRSAEKPNTRMQYSGGGTTVAQLVAMDVSGKDFNAFMKDEVLDPLGMKSSFYRVPNESEQL